MSALAYEAVPKTLDCKSFYPAPNEDVELWRSMVKGLRVERAAGICSGGEVGLLALLPTVRRELVLIDHSRRSLLVAMLKHLLIRQRGATEVRELLGKGSYTDIKAALTAVKDGLPPDLLAIYNRMGNDPREYGSEIEPFGVRDDWYYSAKPSYKPSYKPHPGLQKYWCAVPVRLVQRSGAKLGKVSFIHGDMKVLAERGKFNLIYLSNAFNHAGVTNPQHSTFKAIDEALAPGGYAMVADSRGGYGASTKVCDRAGWETVQSAVGDRNKASIQWMQTLYRKPV